MATVQEEMKLSWLADEKKTDCFAKKTGANLTQMGMFKHHLCVVYFLNGVSTILTIKNMGISLLIGDYK